MPGGKEKGTGDATVHGPTVHSETRTVKLMHFSSVLVNNSNNDNYNNNRSINNNNSNNNNSC